MRQKILASPEVLDQYIPASRSRGVALVKANAGIDHLSNDSFCDLNAIFAVALIERACQMLADIDFRPYVMLRAKELTISLHITSSYGVAL